MKLPDPDCRVGQPWEKETQGEIKTESIVGMLLFLPLFFLLFLCLHLLSLFFLNHTHKEELMIPVGIATMATPTRQMIHPNNLPNGVMG